MMDIDAEKWIGRPAKPMIEIAIDPKNRTVQFRGPVGFEDAKIIVQSLIDGFGWPKQDVTFGHLGCGPTVEPGAPVPVIPGYVSNCTPVPCAICQEAKLAENKPLWEGNPHA